MKLTIYLHLVLSLRMSGVVPFLLLYAFMAWTVTTLAFVQRNVSHSDRFMFRAGSISDELTVLVSSPFNSGEKGRRRNSCCSSCSIRTGCGK
jgi:hypothetical protein